MNTDIFEQIIEKELGRPQTSVEKQIHAWDDEGKPIIIDLNNGWFFTKVYFIECDTVQAICALMESMGDYYTPYDYYNEENYEKLTRKIFYYNNNGDWVDLLDYLEEAYKLIAIVEGI